MCPGQPACAAMCGGRREAHVEVISDWVRAGSGSAGRYGEINRTVIRCRCGHRIVQRDVIQTGLHLTIVGPSFIYIRYRCGRCKRLGEKLVQEDTWDPAVLRPTVRTSDESSRRRFEKMGEITPEEVIEFHYALARISADPEEEVHQP